jgi:hypothetical protein
MKAAGTLSSYLVLYNSVINAAVLIMHNEILAYPPFLQACYVASGVNTDMEFFASTQLDGDSSEGWATAFLWDLYDKNNEINYGNKALGAPKHGDYVCESGTSLCK